MHKTDPTRKERVQQTREQLRSALIEQVSLMMHYCAGYDSGTLALAKPMAASLRIALHQTGRSNSLLQQLGLRTGRFYSAPGRHRSNIVPVGCALTPMSFNAERGGHYVPLLAVPDVRSRLPFPEWWTGIVLRAPTGETMSRMDIVTAVADTDGGAHVDPGLSPLYEAFRSGRLLGMKAVSIGSGQIRMTLPILESTTPSAIDGDGDEGLLKSPQYPCVRTIAHELLLTLEKYAPWSFSVRYRATAA